MKRLVCALMAFFMAASVFAMGEDYLPKRYPLNEYGEAIMNDIPFYTDEKIGDNNRVFYEIFVGSFSDSNGDGIGDLRGIINRMDYLNDGDDRSGVSLGVEGIWLTPIFESPSYHKYDVTDFYTIDPDFGTMEELKELIGLCHERDVKLIIDLPINHTSTQNRWFVNFANSHLLNNPGNAYYDFYSWKNEGDSIPAGVHYAKRAGTRLLYEANFSDSMPELNYDLPAVREEMLNVAKFYLELGVDGFRFDAAKYIYFGDHQKSADFWEWYIGELKKIKPDIYTVSEVWDGDGVIEIYQGASNCFNFGASQVSGIIAETAKGGNVNRYTAYIAGYEKAVRANGEHGMNILFLSNHDMDRASGYLTVASGNMKMAANLYILSPGSPFIYYGEEIGLRGSRGSANTDANRRLKMLWGDGDTVQNPEGATYADNKQTPYSVKDLYPISNSIYNHYKTLITIRKANPEIARGEYTPLQFENTKLGGFVSEWNESAVAVLHNTTNSAITVNLSDATDREFTLISAFIGDGEAVFEDGVLTLPSRCSVVLR